MINSGTIKSIPCSRINANKYYEIFILDLLRDLEIKFIFFKWKILTIFFILNVIFNSAGQGEILAWSFNVKLNFLSVKVSREKSETEKFL